VITSVAVWTSTSTFGKTTALSSMALIKNSLGESILIVNGAELFTDSHGFAVT